MFFTVNSEPAYALSLLTVHMVTLGEPRHGKVSEKEQFELLHTSSSSKHSWRAVVGFTGE